MGVLVGEAIQMIQSMYSKGVQSKDTRLSLRHIYAELLGTRSMLLRQQANKGQKISKWSYQTIPCVELIPASLSECPCVPAMGKYILKTKYKLPTAISGLSDSLISSMTTLDGVTRIDPTEFASVKYNSGKKYTADKSGYYIKNQYGFITNINKLKAITIEGLYDDPIEATNYNSLCGVCEDCNCKDYQDYDLYIDRNILTAMSQITTNKLVLLFGQMREDRSANASDDSGNDTGQMIHQQNQQPLDV